MDTVERRGESRTALSTGLYTGRDRRLWGCKYMSRGVKVSSQIWSRISKGNPLKGGGLGCGVWRVASGASLVDVILLVAVHMAILNSN